MALRPSYSRLLGRYKHILCQPVLYCLCLPARQFMPLNAAEDLHQSHTPVQLPILAVQSVQETAAELAPYCGGCSAEDVEAFLSQLGGIGAGLHELMKADQNIGGIFRECTLLLHTYLWARGLSAREGSTLISSGGHHQQRSSQQAVSGVQPAKLLGSYLRHSITTGTPLVRPAVSKFEQAVSISRLQAQRQKQRETRRADRSPPVQLLPCPVYAHCHKLSKGAAKAVLAAADRSAKTSISGSQHSSGAQTLLAAIGWALLHCLQVPCTTSTCSRRCCLPTRATASGCVCWGTTCWGCWTTQVQ